MEIIETPEQLRCWREMARAPVTLVPTMGNLHAGHLSLIEHARSHGARVIASIFVNPTQFGPNEDFGRYPRTPQADREGLTAAGCDAIWVPAAETMYPDDPADGFGVQVPGRLAGCLCGVHRAGHFDGVANVVMRLFWQVCPDRAVFGEKDWQQLVIIRALARAFSVPIMVESIPTVREADGLAMSSRNRYLNADERARAPELHRALLEAAWWIRTADATGTFDSVRRSALKRLQRAGFEPEYFEVRDQETLGPATGQSDRLFAAARLGQARLIDNVALSRQDCG